MKIPTKTLSIALPTINPNTANFKFSAVINGATYKFNFMWSGSNWRGWCDTPSGKKRVFGVNPNATNWTGYPDLGIVFVTTLSSIGLNDWSKVTMYAFIW